MRIHLWLMLAATITATTLSAAEPGLLAHYPCDGDFRDASGRAGDLTPSITAPPFTADDFVRPAPNRCYGPLSATAGVGTGAMSDRISSDISQGMTLSGFIRKPGTHNYVCMVFGFMPEKPTDPQIWLRLSYGAISSKVGKGYRGDAMKEKILLDGRWHHLAMVIPPAGTSPDVYAVYYDGTKIHEGPVARFPAYGRFEFGTRADRDFGGLCFDEVKVFGRALDPTEVAGLAALTGKPQPMAVAAGGRGSGGSPLSIEPTVPLDQVGEQVAPGVYRSTATQIDRSFVLSPDWLVLVNNYMDETDALIYAAYKGAFDVMLAEQDNREQGRNINWPRYKQRTRLWQNAYVHFSTQHTWMAVPANFTIQSGDDPAYQAPLCPSRSVVWVNSQGARQMPLDAPLRECALYEIGHYAYLQLPSPLRPGCTYTVTQQDGRTATIAFREDKTISSALKVNQIGYLPDAPAKFAYLGAWVPVAGAVDFGAIREFRLCREGDGQPVFTGSVRLRAKDDSTRGLNGNESYSGEDIYELDFSEFRTPGRYFVQVPGLGRSYPFLIAPDALGEAFYVATRGFFHQRCGCELPATNTSWPRATCHHAPMGTCQLVGNQGNWILPDGTSANRAFRGIDFDIIRQTGNTEKTVDAWGGWHDAADYDRRSSHHFPVWDLLGLYEINPAAFTDSQLNLPESGNGIPDLLDEARWGIDHWKRSQSADGSVTGRIETIHHPQHRGMPDQDPDTWYLSLPDRDSTMLYAASASYFARMVQPFSADMAKDYLESAERAYRWAMDPANSRDGFTITVDLKGSGEKSPSPKTLRCQEKDDAHWQAGTLAAINLLQLTGKESYARDLNEKFGPYAVRFFPAYPNWLRYYLPMYLLAKTELPGVDPELRVKAKANLITLADEAVANTELAPYRHAWKEKKSRRWGGAIAPTFARYLILAYRLTGDEKYRRSALLNLDFHLGCNALGMSQTTGLGFRYPPTIQDVETRADGILDPVPGLTPYGVITVPFTIWKNVYSMEVGEVDNERQKRTVQFLPPECRLEDGPRLIPLWRQIGPHDRCDPLCNEFTVMETTGPTAFCLGAFLAPGWQPAAELRNRQPRQRADFDGFYWLP